MADTENVVEINKKEEEERKQSLLKILEETKTGVENGTISSIALVGFGDAIGFTPAWEGNKVKLIAMGRYLDHLITSEIINGE